MSENLDYKTLCQLISNGEIDTVIVAMVDMAGQLVGKRFHAKHFVESAFNETQAVVLL